MAGSPKLALKNAEPEIEQARCAPDPMTGVRRGSRFRRHNFLVGPIGVGVGRGRRPAGREPGQYGDRCKPAQYSMKYHHFMGL